MTEPSGRSTWPSTDVRSPPIVNPAYMALPNVRSNAPHGPVSCGASQLAALWKSGSSPSRAFALYRSSVAASRPAGMPSARSISATVSQPSMNGASGNSGRSMCAESTIR